MNLNDGLNFSIRISGIDENIIKYTNIILEQKEEIIKTENLISQFQKCLATQNDALVQFTKDKENFINEKEILISAKEESLRIEIGKMKSIQHLKRINLKKEIQRLRLQIFDLKRNKKNMPQLSNCVCKNVCKLKKNSLENFSEGKAKFGTTLSKMDTMNGEEISDSSDSPTNSIKSTDFSRHFDQILTASRHTPQLLDPYIYDSARSPVSTPTYSVQSPNPFIPDNVQRSFSTLTYSTDIPNTYMDNSVDRSPNTPAYYPESIDSCSSSDSPDRYNHIAVTPELPDLHMQVNDDISCTTPNYSPQSLNLYTNKKNPGIHLSIDSSPQSPDDVMLNNNGRSYNSPIFSSRSPETCAHQNNGNAFMPSKFSLKSRDLSRQNNWKRSFPSLSFSLESPDQTIHEHCIRSFSVRKLSPESQDRTVQDISQESSDLSVFSPESADRIIYNNREGSIATESQDRTCVHDTSQNSSDSSMFSADRSRHGNSRKSFPAPQFLSQSPYPSTRQYSSKRLLSASKFSPLSSMQCTHVQPFIVRSPDLSLNSFLDTV